MDESNKIRIQEFYSSFQASRTDLSSRLEALKTNGCPSTDVLSALATDVAKLRKELTGATSFLPGYDQRQYELFLKGIENSLEELRISSAPKPKFAFKRKTSKTVPASSTSSTPVASSAPSVKPPVTTEQTSSPHLLLSGRSYKYLDLTALANLGSSSDLTISDLDHCIVNLLPSPSTSMAAQTYQFTALHVRNLTDTVLVLPAIDGSALLHDLKRCSIVLGCHQFRMHTSQDVDVFLSIESNPIIEHCTAIRFSAYPPVLAESVTTGKIFHETSKHLAVQDFSHIRATPSPNWSALLPGTGPSVDDWSRMVEGHPADPTLADSGLLLCLLPTRG